MNEKKLEELLVKITERDTATTICISLTSLWLGGYRGMSGENIMLFDPLVVYAGCYVGDKIVNKLDTESPQRTPNGILITISYGIGYAIGRLVQ